MSGENIEISPIQKSAIENRFQILHADLKKSFLLSESWLETAVNLVGRDSQGLFIAWLGIFGTYPTDREFEDFNYILQTRGHQFGIVETVALRIRNSAVGHFMAHVNLISTDKEHLVDVSSTSRLIFLTGIQRVVFGLTRSERNIETYTIIQGTGLFAPFDIDEASSQKNKTPKMKLANIIIINLHSLSLTLERNRFGRIIREILLPSGRIIKRIILKDQQLEEKSSVEIPNLIIFNKTITLVEIPDNLHSIGIYEALFENNIVKSQFVLYDFIPFFHAWTVAWDNAAHYNSYIRIALFADKVISISELVSQQAEAIFMAFSLERNDSGAKKQEFKFLNLPSGLAPAKPNEFRKIIDSVVMVGSLEPRKNHIQFLEALYILSQRGIKVKAEILGSAGWKNTETLEKIETLTKLGIDIKRISKIEDETLRSKIGMAQLLIQVSEAEGYGLPVAEALALGTKVIVSDIRPLNEFKGDRVQRVKLGDAVGLSDLIEAALSQPEEFTGPVQEIESWEEWKKVLFPEIKIN